MRATAIRDLASDPDQRKALLAEWVEAMTDGPGVSRFRGAFADTAPVDAATAAFHAMIAEEQCRRRRRRRSFRQAGRQRPHLERPGKALPARPRSFRGLLRQRHHRAGLRSLARPVLPDHLAAQLGQPGRRGAIGASRLSSRVPDAGGDRALSGACPPALAGADAAGRRRPLRHAARERADALSALFADLPARLPGDGPAGVPGLFRPSTTCSCP